MFSTLKNNNTSICYYIVCLKDNILFLFLFVDNDFLVFVYFIIQYYKRSGNFNNKGKELNLIWKPRNTNSIGQRLYRDFGPFDVVKQIVSNLDSFGSFPFGSPTVPVSVHYSKSLGSIKLYNMLLCVRHEPNILKY